MQRDYNIYFLTKNSGEGSFLVVAVLQSQNSLQLGTVGDSPLLLLVSDELSLETPLSVVEGAHAILGGATSELGTGGNSNASNSGKHLLEIWKY